DRPVRGREFPARRAQPAAAGDHAPGLDDQDPSAPPGGAVMRGTSWWLIAVLGAAACRNTQADFPTVRDDDAGNYSWARQAIPALFGRKAKGRDEIKLVADLAAATDRASTVRALSHHTQFSDYWSETMVDLLQVDREPDVAFASIPLDDRSLPD